MIPLSKCLVSYACLLLLMIINHSSAFAQNIPFSDKTYQALKAGKLVIYFRHGATTWQGVDNIKWPREQQRLLSKRGIEQSRRIGEAIKKLNIPIGDVLASPFARCRDMAEIAFGRVKEHHELLGLLSDINGQAHRVTFLRKQLSEPSNSLGNNVIVGHRSNIADIAGVSLGEGDAVLILPLGDGKFEILATLAPDDWMTLKCISSKYWFDDNACIDSKDNSGKQTIRPSSSNKNSIYSRRLSSIPVVIGTPL